MASKLQLLEDEALAGTVVDDVMGIARMIANDVSVGTYGIAQISVIKCDKTIKSTTAVGLAIQTEPFDVDDVTIDACGLITIWCAHTYPIEVNVSGNTYSVDSKEGLSRVARKALLEVAVPIIHRVRTIRHRNDLFPYDRTLIRPVESQS